MNRPTDQPGPANRRVARALRWALAASTDPATASADWLASDIDRASASAVEMLTSPAVTVLQLRQAKDAYKTLRIVGEKSLDRRLGARLYAATIAAGLVWHGRRISRQSDGALTRAFVALRDDPYVAEDLRDLADQALRFLQGEAWFERSENAGDDELQLEDDDEDDDPMMPEKPLATPHDEIERVFLLDGPPELPPGARSYRIEQGYFASEPESPDARERAPEGLREGRVRRRWGPGPEDVVCTHTVKEGLGLTKCETERVIGEVEFEAAWEGTAGRRIRKTRHKVSVAGDGATVPLLVWEIDVFDDFDLVLAEVELPSADCHPDLPPWLERHVIREVTDEPAYRNHALAMNQGVGETVRDVRSARR